MNDVPDKKTQQPMMHQETNRSHMINREIGKYRHSSIKRQFLGQHINKFPVVYIQYRAWIPMELMVNMQARLIL